MSELGLLLPAEIWMRNIFDAKAARTGGVVRRGFHAVENARQVIVFCNNERTLVCC